MADLPHTGQPEWEPEQESPWISSNNISRAIEAFAREIGVVRRDADPPSSCDNGDCFLIDTGASGDWAGEEGGVAIASGDDASNGWIIVPAASLAKDGKRIWIAAEKVTLMYQEIGWVEGTMLFIDTSSAPDGGVVRWDQSNREFYVAAE